MWEIYLDNRIVDTYRGLKAVTVGGRGGGKEKIRDTVLTRVTWSLNIVHVYKSGVTRACPSYAWGTEAQRNYT